MKEMDEGSEPSGGKEGREESVELTSKSEAVFLPVLTVVDSRSDDFLDESLLVKKERGMVSSELEKEGEEEGELDDLVPFPSSPFHLHPPLLNLSPAIR